MKRSAILFLPLLLMLASCGTPAQFAQQRFPDGIYTRPGDEPALVHLYSEQDFESMAAAKLAEKRSRDTLVVVLDDPWGMSWYNRLYSPWTWGGLGFGSMYWNRWRYGGWYDPLFHDPWYFGYYDPWYAGWYSPWYYDPWYGGYYGYYGYYGWGHRYGWYDYPYYPGGYWGGSSLAGNRIYTPRSTTQSSISRVGRPGGGTNYRYGTPGSAGSSVISRSGNASRSSTRSTTSRSSASSSSSSATRRSEGYNPIRTYGNESSRNSGTQTRSYSNSSGSSSSSRSSGSVGGGSFGGGGGGYSGGGSSRSGGGGNSGGHSGGRR